jgi:hypothetical protein
LQTPDGAFHLLHQPGAAHVCGALYRGPFGETGLFDPVSGPPVSVRPLGPDFATNAYMDEMANSNYNSLQNSLHHTSASSSFLVGYTYSKCLDNGSSLEEGIDRHRNRQHGNGDSEFV